MGSTCGKYFKKQKNDEKKPLFLMLPLSFFLIEGFAFAFLSTAGMESRWLFFQYNGYAAQELGQVNLWPLAFGVVWAVLLSGIVYMLPRKAGRILYGIFYFLFLIYAIAQTGFFLMFSEMLWFSDFRYASEGSDYLDVLLSYPLSWWLSIPVLIAVGVVVLRKFPKGKAGWKRRVVSGTAAVLAAVGAVFLPKLVFLNDSGIQYAGSDYGRAQSAEAAYENMFNAHRLYQVCGVFQTAVKDVYTHYIYPITPSHAKAMAEEKEAVESYLSAKTGGGSNGMTGIFAGKNIVLVLMESMDDWMIGEHTPTLQKLMAEGMNFTRFYTPGYGGVRTFNSEFCINTGSFLSTSGGYAFDYVTNCFDQSLASLLLEQGYSTMVYHYNDPSFYSRGVFSRAMGYQVYNSYQDYVTEETQDSLYDDQFLFDNPGLSDSFFREGKKLNFIITRSAHLSYKYNEVLSYWGLKKYPQYRGLTGNEETDCAYLKARLVDDLFARLLQELEEKGELENTVIIAVTDHYTYGYKDVQSLLELSGVEDTLLLERTPCFIWSADLAPMEVDKVLNTSDLLPTVLNLLGVESQYRYIGNDAFDDSYDGFVPFSNGSWISGDVAYDASTGKVISISGEQQTVTADFRAEMAERVQAFIRINNLILETDYYNNPD